MPRPEKGQRLQYRRFALGPWLWGLYDHRDSQGNHFVRDDRGNVMQVVSISTNAVPRLLISYADPGVGHDGGLYRGAGARFCGPGTGGRLLFAWALDPALQDGLDALGQAAGERRP